MLQKLCENRCKLQCYPWISFVCKRVWCVIKYILKPSISFQHPARLYPQLNCILGWGGYNQNENKLNLIALKWCRLCARINESEYVEFVIDTFCVLCGFILAKIFTIYKLQNCIVWFCIIRMKEKHSLKFKLNTLNGVWRFWFVSILI